MPSTRTFNRSFAGGELSPEMFGRIDDVKFQTGAAKMRNFIATPQGPAENRPGTMFVRDVKYSNKKTRLISFTYSTTQTMVIEIGAGYFRFHTNGGTVLSAGVPYEVANPYLEADLFDIHYVQSSDVLTLVHPNYPPAELRRLGATNWTYTVISFTPTVAKPTGVAVTASPGYKSQISTWDTVTGLITTVNNHTLSEGDGIYISGVSGPTNTPNEEIEVLLFEDEVVLSQDEVSADPPLVIVPHIHQEDIGELSVLIDEHHTLLVDHQLLQKPVDLIPTHSLYEDVCLLVGGVGAGRHELALQGIHCFSPFLYLRKVVRLDASLKRE